MFPRKNFAIAATMMVLCAGAVRAYQDLPPGHPRLPLPSGHPPVGERPDVAPPEVAPADPKDVASVDAVIAAYYESISGPKGEPRDWQRFRSLFAPGARLMTTRASAPHNVLVVLAPEEYVSSNSNYFEGGGYFEHELHRQVDAFGNIAHVFSTYASKRSEADAKPYSRGINSLQLVYDGERWWIVTVIWDYERSKDNPIPPKYLPDAAE